MRVAVLGASGLMGRAIVVDLRDSAEVTDILELDRERSRAAGGDVTAIDAADRQQLTLALEEYDVLVNAASYPVNLPAMDAALAAKCHYVDLGGLHHMTAKQFGLHDGFAAAGLMAVLGCGAAPGKSNVMAAWAAEGLDEVHAIRCASAGHDDDPSPGIALPYALATLMAEVTEAPVVRRDGEFVELAPMADGGEIAFPEPIGARSSIHTLHSEVLTLGESLGAPDVDFRLALTPKVENVLRQVARGVPAPPTAAPSASTYSAQVVEVTGLSGGAPTTVTATALTVPHVAWGIGGGVVSTASVAAAVVRLIARGDVLDPTGYAPLGGVHPPERALHHATLFPELERRGCTFTIERAEG